MPRSLPHRAPPAAPWHAVASTSVKFLVWLLAIFVLLLVVAVPVSYLYGAAQLPTLESELDLEKLLRAQIEGERRGAAMGRFARDSVFVPFERPDLSRVP